MLICFFFPILLLLLSYDLTSASLSLSLSIKCSRSTSAIHAAYFGPSGRVLKLRVIRTFFHFSVFFCYRIFRFFFCSTHFAGKQNTCRLTMECVDDIRHSPLGFLFNSFFFCATSISFSSLFFCVFFFSSSCSSHFLHFELLAGD